MNADRQHLVTLLVIWVALWCKYQSSNQSNSTEHYTRYHGRRPIVGKYFGGSEQQAGQKKWNRLASSKRETGTYKAKQWEIFLDFKTAVSATKLSLGVLATLKMPCSVWISFPLRNQEASAEVLPYRFWFCLYNLTVTLNCYRSF